MITAAAILATFGALGAVSSVRGGVVAVDGAGITTNGEQGDPANTVLFFDLGADAQVTGIGYNVDLTAFDPSFLSEITVSFSSSDATSAGVILTPGFDRPESGSGSFSSNGIIDLAASGLNFNVGDDGKLRVEFYEGVNDAGVSPDGMFNSGTFSVQYAAAPECSTWVFVSGGLGALLIQQRRRKQTPLGRC